MKIRNIITAPILIKSGLSQGDAKSLILFNIVLEKVIRVMNITPQEEVKFQRSSIGLLAYADNLVTKEELQDGLRSLLYLVEKVVLNVGHINENKMEYMFIGIQDATRIYTKIKKIFVYINIYKISTTVISKKQII